MDPTIPTPVSPVIGMAASIVYGEDWYPATVRMISEQMEFLTDEFGNVTTRFRPSITVQQDAVIDEYGTFGEDPSGQYVQATKRDDDVWRAVGTDAPIVVLGIRRKVVS